MNDFNFKVDLKGIIRLLSESLYSNDSVFLRELLQNGVDAIEARKQQQPDFQQGEICVDYTPSKNGAILHFCDNGVGLTREEIHSFLSVIGQSSKRGEEARGSFIGQFGIGLLSCFLVANEICVVTRSAKEDTAWQWLGRSDGTYEITESDGRAEQGTEIRVVLTGRMRQKYGESEITRALAEYGFLIPTPIRFTGRQINRTLNENFIPWRQELSTAGEIMDFGEQLFGHRFFDFIPLSGDGLNGYAFISDRQTSASADVRHKIYLKDMFITEDGRELVPKWAFFVQCIVDAQELTPTASREGFSRDGKLLRVKSQIEKSIMDYFVSLSKYDVNKLKTLTSIHNVAIKALAVENDKIFRLFFPFLMFTTSRGNLTGFQLLNAAKKMPVYYCISVDDFRRVCPMLENSSRLLINAGYIYDANILQRLPKFYKNIPIKAFEDSAMENLFDEPEEEEKEALSVFMEAADEALKPFRCKSALRRFSPAGLSALYVPGEDAFLGGALEDDPFDAEGYSTFLEGFSPDYMDLNLSTIYLNGDNPLIQKLSTLRDPEMMHTVAEVLYVQALMAGHYPLGNREMETLGRGLTALIEFGLS